MLPAHDTASHAPRLLVRVPLLELQFANLGAILPDRRPCTRRPAGKAADVKLCYAMRGALSLLDFDDPSIADMKRLLLRAAFAPPFLQRAEVRGGTTGTAECCALPIMTFSW